MSHCIKWSDNNTLIKLKGDVSLGDMLDITMIINSDNRFSKMKYRIYDFNEVTSFQAPEYEMSNIVEINEKSTSWNNKLKIAAVSSDQKIAEIVKEFTKRMKSSGWEIVLFSTVQEAMVWCKS